MSLLTWISRVPMRVGVLGKWKMPPSKGKMDYEAMVTNLDWDEEDVWRFYNPKSDLTRTSRAGKPSRSCLHGGGESSGVSNRRAEGAAGWRCAIDRCEVGTGVSTSVEPRVSSSKGAPNVVPLLLCFRNWYATLAETELGVESFPVGTQPGVEEGRWGGGG